MDTQNGAIRMQRNALDLSAFNHYGKKKPLYRPVIDIS